MLKAVIRFEFLRKLAFFASFKANVVYFPNTSEVIRHPFTAIGLPVPRVLSVPGLNVPFAGSG